MEHAVPSPRVSFQSMERYMGRNVLLVCKVLTSPPEMLESQCEWEREGSMEDIDNV